MNHHSEAFEILRQSIQEILPDVSADRIQHQARLDDLGADSVDRAEIFSATLRRLQLRIPLAELSRANKLADVIEVLDAHRAATVS